MKTRRFMPLLSAIIGGLLLAGPVSGQDQDDMLPISADEVAKHDKRSDCWTIIDGRVYDITDYLAAHSNEAGFLARRCGRDSSGEWDSQVAQAEGVDNVHQLFFGSRMGRLAGH